MYAYSSGQVLRFEEQIVCLFFRQFGVVLRKQLHLSSAFNFQRADLTEISHHFYLFRNYSDIYAVWDARVEANSLQVNQHILRKFILAIPTPTGLYTIWSREDLTKGSRNKWRKPRFPRQNVWYTSNNLKKMVNNIWNRIMW